MFSFDLANEPLPEFFILMPLKANELCYLRLKSIKNLNHDDLYFITFATKKSSRVILSIPAEDMGEKAEIQKLFNLGVYGFALQVTDKVEKFLNYRGLDKQFSGDLDIIDIYQNSLPLVPNEKILWVEFQVGQDTRMLGPTIAAVHKLGSQSVILNVPGTPTRMRTSQFREMFEYLKIRSLNRLNVYFPFWSRYSREWDAKTQNTFSGLSTVHIDISNRCTHSCAFCSLYGPDAMIDNKNDNGKLPKILAELMKREIQHDKCISIIKSLPWSVDVIQFGGMGDPLMHDHAVEFIAEARMRGFRVEMLSNMEYLTEEDVKLLTNLGSKNLLDLNFIANVSGGNEETYIRTRPRQTSKEFNKVIKNLEMLRDYRKANGGKGAGITLMCVVNKHNCHDLEAIAELAVRIEAVQIWFKPMEIHGEVHKTHVPTKDLMQTLAQSLKNAMEICQKNNLYIQHKDYCDEIIKTYLGDAINV